MINSVLPWHLDIDCVEADATHHYEVIGAELGIVALPAVY